MLRAVWWTIAGIGAVMAIVVVLSIAGFTVSNFLAPFQGEAEKRQQVEGDGDYRIAAYDEFYSLCSSASSAQDKIENQEAQIAATEDPQQKQVLQSGVLAMENQLDEIVNKYNTKAASDYTSGQFRDSDLPYQLDSEQEITCGN